MANTVVALALLQEEILNIDVEEIVVELKDGTVTRVPIVQIDKEELQGFINSVQDYIDGV